MLILADMALLVGSFGIAALTYPGVFSTHDAMLPAYMLLPLFQTIAFYNATYSRDGLTNWRTATWRAVLALVVSALMFSFFAFFAKASAEFSRVVFVSSLAVAAVGMGVIRWTLARFIVALWGPSVTNRLLIEAGGPSVAIPDSYRVNARDHGLLPDLEDPLALDRLSKYLRNMDMVIVSCSREDRLAWSAVLRGSGIHGEVISDFAQEIGALAIVRHEEADVTALVVSRGHLALRARVTKRLFDLVVTVLALIVLSPVLLACAFAIKLDDRGPIFFRQRRMGRGNQFFDIYKFRSMQCDRADAAGHRSAAKNDDRITRVGRILRTTSLDELPQLINVLKGDMSTVGSRLSVAESDDAVRRCPAGRTVGCPAPGAIRMIGRLGWILALLVVAVVTAFAQIDRSARFAPEFAAFVPAPFRGFAQARQVEQALVMRDADRAVERAKALVRNRPVPAENLTLLAQAELMSGDVANGLAALELAGQRGWREPLAQQTLAQAALMAGELDTASQRVVALLATGSVDRAAREQLVTGLATTPEGRAAIANRLAERGHWQRNFVALGPTYLSAGTYADIILRAQGLGANVDCLSLAQAEGLLRQAGHADLASQITRTACTAR